MGAFSNLGRTSRRSFRPATGATLAGSEPDAPAVGQSWLGWLAGGAPAVGVGALALYSATLGGAGWSALGTGLGAATAGAAMGAMLGFLFGIPRSMQHDRPAGGDMANYRPNTNLEQISDWLTKILVGIGLVEFRSAIDPARQLVNAVGEGLGDTAAARVVAASLLVVFTVWGFLLSYLITRSRVARLFEESDLQRITRQAAHLASDEVRQQLSDQAQADAAALDLVERVLNPAGGSQPPTQEELEAALRDAGPGVRVLAFGRAKEQRSTNWRSDPVRMARTIPIFRALIALDTERRYHRNHGQLGYALKDQPQPDFAAALEALTEAINRRDLQGERGLLFYEYNRALCRIAVQRAPSGRATPGERDLILADLRATAANRTLKRLLTDEQAVRDWLGANDLTVADLSA